MADDAGRLDAWLRRLAGHGLPGTPPLGRPPALAELLSGATRHKLTGVLAAAVADGAIELAPADRARVADAHEDAMREVLLLEEELLACRRRARRAPVSTIGCSRVRPSPTWSTPTPAERCFGDNDLLVAGRRHRPGRRPLWSRRGPPARCRPSRRSFDRRFAKSVTLQLARIDRTRPPPHPRARPLRLPRRPRRPHARPGRRPPRRPGRPDDARRPPSAPRRDPRGARRHRAPPRERARSRVARGAARARRRRRSSTRRPDGAAPPPSRVGLRQTATLGHERTGGRAVGRRSCRSRRPIGDDSTPTPVGTAGIAARRGRRGRCSAGATGSRSRRRCSVPAGAEPRHRNRGDVDGRCGVDGGSSPRRRRESVVSALEDRADPGDRGRLPQDQGDVGGEVAGAPDLLEGVLTPPRRGIDRCAGRALHHHDRDRRSRRRPRAGSMSDGVVRVSRVGGGRGSDRRRRSR